MTTLISAGVSSGQHVRSMQGRQFHTAGILPAVLHSVMHRKSAGETPAVQNRASCRRNNGISGRVAVAALFLLFWPGLPGTESTTLARMDLRELTARAAYVARVRCVDAKSSTDGSLVWTVITFEVIEAWKGDLPARFAVRLPGGEAAGYRVTVEGAPRFAAGEEAVLFLDPERRRQLNIVTWAQGTFRIRRNPRTGEEEAMQDTAGLQVFDPQTAKWSQGEQRRMPLTQLRALVAQAIAESAR